MKWIFKLQCQNSRSRKKKIQRKENEGNSETNINKGINRPKNGSWQGLNWHSSHMTGRQKKDGMDKQ